MTAAPETTTERPRAALVTGATGLLGARLLQSLEQGRILVRDVEAARGRFPGAVPFGWDASREVPGEALDGVGTVFHLAGEPVAKGRWTSARREGILASRVDGTRRIVEAIRRASVRPTVLVSASAVGFYGSRGDEVLTEESVGGEGFLADVCRAWEREARAAEQLGVRVVVARIGVVLAKDGGALAAMLPLFRLGLGGPVGTGRQWVPWVHVDDVVGLLLHAARAADIRGPMNVCAPEPVTNAALTRALGSALGKPTVLKAPASLLRLAVGDLAEVVLGSQRVLPSVAHRTAYRFRHREIVTALRAEVHAPRHQEHS